MLWLFRLHSLLNLVDAQQSALVIAPTSSGKTFISYYIMKMVMEEKSVERPLEVQHEYPGCVLYVCPNKQLVNQVAAEIEARYSKKQRANNVYTIGVLTQDEREHVDNCQILVMEPSCAETLLLAGRHSALFPRIRFVIFDEVHNIVGKDGCVWEHLLTFIAAPFVALSATVGNPKEFGEWLGRLEAVRALCDCSSACVSSWR